MSVEATAGIVTRNLVAFTGPVQDATVGWRCRLYYAITPRWAFYDDPDFGRAVAVLHAEAAEGARA